MSVDWLDQINWNDDGLIPAIAQDWESDRVLMQAWVNRESSGAECSGKQGCVLVALATKTLAQG